MVDAKELAENIADKIIGWRRELHKIPEVGLETPKTAAFITSSLEQMGIEVETGVAGHGVVALIRGEKRGKTIGIRADIDGLAIKEETGLPFSSLHKGNMHACGHDAHAAMALGAAKILQEKRGEIAGNVKFIFQPAEEGPGGAKPMIEAGVLKDPDVEAIIGQHIGAIFDFVGPGQVGIGYDVTMACLDSFSITIKGKGGHGAQPQATVDPIVIGAEVIQSLQTLISRELKPTRPGVITVGKINGGTAYNIIPERLQMEGTARFLHERERQIISRRIGELAEGIAKAKRGECEFNYHYGYPPLVSDPDFTKYFAAIAREIVGAENVIEITEPTTGGEDMAYFLQEVPGTFFFLGGAREQDGRIYPHHHPKFDIDESVLTTGTALFVATALKWLQDNTQ